jgi:hypothetical protein
MAYKQQLEFKCLEWKSPSNFNEPLYVLPALLWSVKLNMTNNRAFCMSALRERLKLDVIKLFNLNVLELNKK